MSNLDFLNSFSKLADPSYVSGQVSPMFISGKSLVCVSLVFIYKLCATIHAVFSQVYVQQDLQVPLKAITDFKQCCQFFP